MVGLTWLIISERVSGAFWRWFWYDTTLLSVQYEGFEVRPGLGEDIKGIVSLPEDSRVIVDRNKTIHAAYRLLNSQ
jgi:hypothetical protein